MPAIRQTTVIANIQAININTVLSCVSLCIDIPTSHELPGINDRIRIIQQYKVYLLYDN